MYTYTMYIMSAITIYDTLLPISNSVGYRLLLKYNYVLKYLNTSALKCIFGPFVCTSRPAGAPKVDNDLTFFQGVALRLTMPRRIVKTHNDYVVRPDASPTMKRRVTNGLV